MQNASDSVLDDRVVVTCCKNNDGKLGPRGCFRRSSGQWPLVTDFDWKIWDNPPISKHSPKVDYTQEILQILDNGVHLSKSQLIDAFMALRESNGQKIGKSAAYDMFSKNWFKQLVSVIPRTGLYRLR
jgi:hypothetical protein